MLIGCMVLSVFSRTVCFFSLIETIGGGTGKILKTGKKDVEDIPISS